MGNNASSSHRGGAAAEWKGPFSDPEYECLVVKYKDVTTGATTVSDVHVRLQKLLQLPSSESIPEQYQVRINALGTAFYELCLLSCEADGRTAASNKVLLIDFVQAVAACVRSSSQSIARALFRLFAATHRSTISEDELTQLFHALLIMADDKIAVEDPHKALRMAQKLTHAVLPSPAGSTPQQTSNDEFVRWLSGQFPLFYSVFVSWMATKCLDALARPSYHAPRLSHKSDILSRAHFVCLSAVANPIQKPLYRLYTSAQDGLSFNRLCFHLLGYTGPTLVVIQNTEGAVFGMFCDSGWKESSRMYGGNGCFLFRLEPQINIYRVSGVSNDNFMYLNSKGYSLPRGIGMGGNTNKFRLFVSEDFDESSYTTTQCMSFESGKLSSREHFTIDAMEVWGCGDEEDLLNQKASRKETAEMINRARKVDKAQFVGSDFDKEMFFGKTFGHGTNQARVADDES
ncbi:hypothetical protein FI667_g5459, partial [Globisporangium splendens]